MQVIGQHHDRVGPEGSPTPRIDKCLPQGIDVLGQKTTTTFEQSDGEEKAATGNEGADISRHGPMLAMTTGLDRDALHIAAPSMVAMQ